MTGWWFWPAAMVPGLIAYNVPPSPTLFNQIAAVGLWSAALLAVRTGPGVTLRSAALHSRALWVPLALVGAAAVCSSAFGALPWGLGLSAAGLLLACMALVIAGAAVPPTRALLIAFFGAWVAAGVCSSLIAAMQVFAPQWTGGDWIARSGVPGRAVGNLRQPNHLATLLLWSAVAVVPLVELGVLRGTTPRRALAWGLMVLTVLGITLSGSRTGLVGIAALALWGLADRRLSRLARGLLISAPVVCVATVALAQTWSAANASQAIGAATRLGQEDLSTSRFAIWRDTLVLIVDQPWLGVGFGEFNFAWTLTPLPDRPSQFFDHTHNLPLQLAVELGLPLAGLVIGLLVVALWQAARRTWAVPGEQGAALRAAFAMVLLAAMHSQLEYPLWYAHFLLPAAFTWGLCLGASQTGTATQPAGGGQNTPVWAWTAGAAMALATLVVLADYRRVTVIFAPSATAKPLEERIADGQRSWFFAHHADYAAATTAARPADAMAAFERSPHHLLDTRLMIAWATALAQSGDVDRARHLAARLKEFRNPDADAFYAPCEDTAIVPRPFQCEPPERSYSWRDFR